jgi:hypothetical protein
MKVYQITTEYECCGNIFTEIATADQIMKISEGADDDWSFCPLCGEEVPWKEEFVAKEDCVGSLELGDSRKPPVAKTPGDSVCLETEGSGQLPEKSRFYGLDITELANAGQVYQEGVCGSPHCRDEECAGEDLSAERRHCDSRGVMSHSERKGVRIFGVNDDLHEATESFAMALLKWLKRRTKGEAKNPDST